MNYPSSFWEEKEEGQQEQYVETVKNVQLARAYVPFQQWEKPYPPEKALVRGTIFKGLYDPKLRV